MGKHLQWLKLKQLKLGQIQIDGMLTKGDNCEFTNCWDGIQDLKGS